MSRIVLDRPVDHVARLSMNDPAGRNALDDEVRAAMAAHLVELYRDDTVRAIVIGSSGRNFCTGGDLKAVSGHAAGQPAHAVMRRVNELARVIDASPKPFVAAVGGHCIGAGAGLALMCDVVVAGKSARIGFPFLGVGVVADFGLSWSLPRRMGVQAARRALIEALSFAGDDAARAGLFDYVCEDDALAAAAVARAQSLAQAPANALMLMRQMLKDPPHSLAAALDLEALNQAMCFGSDELREGLAAFAAKRRPDFIAAGRRADPAA